jgi:hypothetical protein
MARGGFAIAAVAALLTGLAPNGAQAETRYSVGPEARRRKALRAYLKLVPSTGFTPRGSLIASKASTKKITAKNSKSLVQIHEAGRSPFCCQLGL